MSNSPDGEGPRQQGTDSRQAEKSIREIVEVEITPSACVGKRTFDANLRGSYLKANLPEHPRIDRVPLEHFLEDPLKTTSTSHGQG